MSARLLPLLLCLAACSSSGSTPVTDAGPLDAGPARDAGPADAGPVDAGAPDAGVLDAGPPTDAERTDAGIEPDAGPGDAGTETDAGPPDAGPLDAGTESDAGPDAGPVDAGQLVPDPPTFVNVVVNGDQLDVTWGAPLYEGAAPIDGYSITYNLGSQYSNNSTRVPSTPLSAVVTPTTLTPSFPSLGGPFLLSIEAHNVYGYSAPTTITQPYMIGRFGPGVALVNHIGHPVGKLAVSDVNNDGLPDFTMDGYNGSTFHPAIFTVLNLGDGGFGPELVTEGLRFLPPPGEELFLPDLNGDGSPDFVSGFDVAFGQGDGTFAPLLTGCGAQVNLGFGDFFGDGHPGLICFTPMGLMLERFFPDGGDVTQQIPPPDDAGPYTATDNGITVGDFNNDGFADAFLAECGGSAPRASCTLLGDGRGGFTQLRYPYAVSHEYDGVAVDFDHDGNLDLLNDQGSLLFGDGTGALTRGSSPISNEFFVSTQDLDGDGWADIATVNTRLNLVLNQHNRTWAREIYCFTEFLSAGTFFDLNGDGKLDFISASWDPSTSSSTIYVHYAQ